MALEITAWNFQLPFPWETCIKIVGFFPADCLPIQSPLLPKEGKKKTMEKIREIGRKEKGTEGEGHEGERAGRAIFSVGFL